MEWNGMLNILNLMHIVTNKVHPYEVSPMNETDFPLAGGMLLKNAEYHIFLNAYSS